MNQIIYSGRLTADIETRAAGEQQVQSFTVAVNQGERATFIPTETWNMPHLSRCLRKGSRVLVRGSLRQDAWETPEGERRSRFCVTGYEVEFLDRPAEGGDRDGNGGSRKEASSGRPARGRRPVRSRSAVEEPAEVYAVR